MKTTHTRGYALILVLMVLALLSVGLGTLFVYQEGSANTTGSLLERRRVFYACDGIGRSATVLAQRYLTTATPTPKGLIDTVCEAASGGVAGTDGCCAAKLGACSPDDDANEVKLLNDPLKFITPAGFTIQDLTLRSGQSCSSDADCPIKPEIGPACVANQCVQNIVAPLPNGPFEGMSARQATFNLAVTAEHTATTGFRCSTSQSLTLGKIAMFQFFIFSDQEYTDWMPGADMFGTGRVHVNGNICLRAGTSLYLDRVTASGRIDSGTSAAGSSCRAPTIAEISGDGVKVAIRENATFTPTPGPTVSQGGTADATHHFRAFQSRNDTTWKNDADVKYARRLQDAAHGVPVLKLPIFSIPVVQRGKNANLTNVSNNETSRFLVDPLRVQDGSAPDTADIRAQKFAFKADIRIVNGVWYKRDPAFPERIGTPIWSDHHGSFNTLAYGSTAEAVVPSAGLNVGQRDLFGSDDRPKRYSYYRWNNATPGVLQHSTTDPSAVISYGPLIRQSSNNTWKPAFYSSGTLTATSDGAELRAGTKQGFRDVHAEKESMGDVANILPINFDVAAFQNALADVTPLSHELGTHFPPGTFNGIVYITTTWRHSSAPDDTSPTRNTHPGHPNAGRGQMPEALCSTEALSPADVSADCGTYYNTVDPTSSNPSGARPNAVRIYNARNINQMASGIPEPPPILDSPARGNLTPAGGPRGLTVITNLPLYVLGDVNTSSDVSGQWVPFLVGGDTITLMSNAWTDKTSPNNPAAANTVYNMEILSGWLPTTSSNVSGGIQNFPRFVENWTSRTAKIRGSIVIGWHAVYTQWKRSSSVGTGATNAYFPPNRDWGFDPNLNDLENQPPGTPMFDVAAVRQWARQ